MGKFKSSSASIGVLTVIALLFPTASSATTDPYPNLNTGDELPDTRVWSTTETSWAEFAQTTYRVGWACPRFETPKQHTSKLGPEWLRTQLRTGLWFQEQKRAGLKLYRLEVKKIATNRGSLLAWRTSPVTGE